MEWGRREWWAWVEVRDVGNCTKREWNAYRSDQVALGPLEMAEADIGLMAETEIGIANSRPGRKRIVHRCRGRR